MTDKMYSSYEREEKEKEEKALNALNEKMAGKVVPQNHDHNARKEGFSRKEQNRNN